MSIYGRVVSVIVSNTFALPLLPLLRVIKSFFLNSWNVYVVTNYGITMVPWYGTSSRKFKSTVDNNVRRCSRGACAREKNTPSSFCFAGVHIVRASGVLHLKMLRCAIFTCVKSDLYLYLFNISCAPIAC